MARKIDWESQIGRRLRLRDLHVFFTVVQRGSMAKAAAQLGVSQPAVSEVIADLEHALGVRLLDRNSQGVEPTIYGRALLKRGTVVFDELKQSIRDIEFLADPTTGEVRIGCAESLASGLLSPVLQQFSMQYPRVVLHVSQMVTPTLDLPDLRERNLDLVLARLGRPLGNGGDELNVETIFHDDVVIAAGMQTQWARRQDIDLAELVDEPWILMPPNSWNDVVLADAFRARGLAMPKPALTTFSVHLRVSLLTTGPFLTTFPGSILRLNPGRFAIKVLPIELSAQPWPVAVVTLKNRTLSPVVQLFIDQLAGATVPGADDSGRASDRRAGTKSAVRRPSSAF
jgi:DNA-binding transcriptional LysR family regulator